MTRQKYLRDSYPIVEWNWFLFIFALVATAVTMVLGMRILRAYERTLEVRETETALKLERAREMTAKAEGRWASYYAKIAKAQQGQDGDDSDPMDQGTNWDPKLIGMLHGMG